MEDSIINIDECDSLSLSSDTDIKSIVDQWKRKDKIPEHKDLKNFDTRTFTRPKKRLFTGTNVNGMFQANNTFTDDSSDDQATTSRASVPKIDLKIGGLVTSMQRSYLGDVSPPSNMDSSIEPMGNSLITSMDFSNVNEFINGNDESLSLANFNQYRLSDAINDRNFLERLTNYDESLFTKDADINNCDIDSNHLISNGTLSSNSTLQNSTDSAKNDDTFVAAGQLNGTFNAVGEVDRTFIQAPADSSSQSKNGTFEIGNETFDAKNGTFDAKNGTFDAKKAFSEFNNTTDALEDEELSLYGTFKVENDVGDFKKPDGFGMTITRQRSPKVDLNSTITKKDLVEEYQSTPARRDIKNVNKRRTLANISPILSEQIKHQNSMKNVEQFIDVEIEDFPVLMRQTPPRSIDRQTSNPTGVNHALREKQRQSLANFEEFENTLLILENNKTEEEFDDLLNSFSTKHRNPLSDKVRQSLDNIKKRHSFMGMEKQQQDELNREKTMNISQNEKNRILNESFNRSAMMSSTSSTGSSGGERLLRRSRLFDDVINTSGSSTDELHKSSSGSSISVNDNRQIDTTEILNRTNQSQIIEENTQLKTDHTMIYNTNEIKNENKSNSNRDRFKTIRIFKKPPENAVQIPDTDELNAESSPSLSQPLSRTVELFATKNTNSPKLATTNMNNNEECLERNTGSQKAINTMTFKRSSLARPRQLSGLNKRELYAKSNSHELLLSDDHASQSSKFQSTTTVSQLKSPMGVKSKSIHNLNTVKSSMAAPLKTSAQPSTFKVPAAKPLANMRQRNDVGQPKKLSLIRPSSGYYGYNTKRTDSDNESAKFSSNNSLSSASSRSSASRGETPETYMASNENPNSTFVQAPVKAVPSSSSITSSNIQSKLSLLRPPTQIRKSGLPRPTAFTAKR